MDTSAFKWADNFMKKFISVLVWASIVIIVLWSMTSGTMDILGFKECHSCGKLVRGKSEYRVIKDKWICCNECYETWRIAQ